MAQNTIEIQVNAKDNATAILRSISQELGEAGKQASKIASEMAIATAAMVAALGLAVSSAVQFNASMTNVAAVMGLTAQQQAALTTEIQDFGARAVSGPQAVAAAYYDIVGGVADTTTHMAILTAAENTAVAGATSLTSTTQALIAVMNSYGFAADQAGFASDVLTRTVGVGVGTMAQFADSMGQIAGLAASLSIPFDELGAQMAFLTTKGISAGEAMTQLRAVMNVLITPNETMKKLLQEIGFESGQAAIQQMGLRGALSAVSQAAEESGANINAALGSVWAINAAVALSGNDAAQAMKNFETGIAGATDRAKEIQLTSASAQIDLFKAAIEGLRISVGNALLPALAGAISMLQPLLLGFQDFITQNPQLVQAFATIVGILAAVVGSMFTVVPAINAVKGAIDLLMAGSLGPVAIILSLVAAAFVTNFGGIRDFFMESIFPVIQSFGSLVGELFDVLSPLLNAIFELFGSTIGVILDLVKPFFDVLKGLIDMVVGFIKLLKGDLPGAMSSFGAPTNPLVQQAQAARDAAMRQYQQGAPTVTPGAASNVGSNLAQSGMTSGVGGPVGSPLTMPGTGGVVYDNAEAAYQAALRAAQGQGQNYQISVQMPQSALANPGAAQQAGKDFGTAIYDELRRRG